MLHIDDKKTDIASSIILPPLLAQLLPFVHLKNDCTNMAGAWSAAQAFPRFICIGWWSYRPSRVFAPVINPILECLV